MSRSSIGAVVSTRNVVEKETELDANKRLALEIRTQIEGASVEDRKKRLNDVYNKWVIESKPQSNSIFSTLERALQNYGLTAEGLRIGHFEKATKLVLFEITYLYLFMSQKNSVEDQQEDTELVEEDAEYKEIKMKFNKIFSTITDAENAVRNSLFLQNSMMEEEFSISENDNGLYRFTPIDYSTNSPYQNLLLYLLERLMKKGYRRYNDECYKPIYTETGFNTHAWECAMSIRNFIHEVTKKELNFNMWKNLTSSNRIHRGGIRRSHKGQTRILLPKRNLYHQKKPSRTKNNRGRTHRRRIHLVRRIHPLRGSKCQSHRGQRRSSQIL